MSMYSNRLQPALQNLFCLFAWGLTAFSAQIGYNSWIIYHVGAGDNINT